MLHHIIYVSQAVRPLPDAELLELLEQCRRDNERLEITGILFYSHGQIAQLIEGSAENLYPLYERIAQDARHANVTKMSDKTIPARSFAGWSMAFRPLDPSGFAALAGFFEPEQPLEIPAEMSQADALLLRLVRQAVLHPTV